MYSCHDKPTKVVVFLIHIIYNNIIFKVLVAKNPARLGIQIVSQFVSWLFQYGDLPKV